MPLDALSLARSDGNRTSAAGLKLMLGAADAVVRRQVIRHERAL
jgi:hypothetical protein